MKLDERYDIQRDKSSSQWFYVVDMWNPDEEWLFEGTYEVCERYVLGLIVQDQKRAEEVLYIMTQLSAVMRKVY